MKTIHKRPNFEGEQMSDDSFVMEMCGNKSAWQIQVDGIEKIDLESVGGKIESAGYTVGIRTRLAWTFPVQRN